VISQSLRQLTPATTFALYLYDADSDLLVCEHAVGDPLKLLSQLTISLGERVTGWCGANLSTAINSDAELDLAQIADSFDPPLRSAMSTPLVKGDRLLGVLTGYSPKTEAFQEHHMYVFEHVASMLSAILDRRDSKSATVTPFRRVR
jgi:GAF domain-containing protein